MMGSNPTEELGRGILIEIVFLLALVWIDIIIFRMFNRKCQTHKTLKTHQDALALVLLAS